jgi:hypothetical protein
MPYERFVVKYPRRQGTSPAGSLSAPPGDADERAARRPDTTMRNDIRS